MQWFKHDADSATDAKLKKLILRHGTDGYAIYFHCLELISGDISEANLNFELEHDAEIIADNLKIKGTPEISAIDKVNIIMKYIVSLGLFQESKGRICCLKMLKRLDLSMTSNAKMRKMITKAKECHDIVMTNHDSVMQEENRKDKNRLDKIRNIYTCWNNKTNLQTHQETVIEKRIQKKHIDLIDVYGEKIILQAIENYNIILGSDKYYFTYKWTLWDFITRGIDKFSPDADPLNNFINEKKVDREESEPDCIDNSGWDGPGNGVMT